MNIMILKAKANAKAEANFFKKLLVAKIRHRKKVRKTVVFLSSIFTDFVCIFFIKNGLITRVPRDQNLRSAVKCSASSTKRDLYETIYEHSTDFFAS